MGRLFGDKLGAIKNKKEINKKLHVHTGKKKKKMEGKQKVRNFLLTLLNKLAANWCIQSPAAINKTLLTFEK